MTGKRPPPTGSRTPVDQLRNDLDQCEILVHQVGVRRSLVSFAGDAPRSAREDGWALLRLLDHVAAEMDRLEERGVDLRAERVRFENVQSQLRRRDKVLVEQLGPSLAAERPSDARWWWYLDKQVAARRRRQIERVVAATLLGLILVVVLFLLYDRFLAAPPNVREAHSRIFEGERAMMEGDIPGAIERFVAATAADPESADAHLWLGALYEAMGKTDQAADAFDRAQALLDTEIEFLLQRGLVYLTLNNIDAAGRDASAVIELAPLQPQGYFLMGNVADQVGDLELARDSFQRASDLAEATGQLELQVTSRVRLSDIIQRLIALPQP